MAFEGKDFKLIRRNSLQVEVDGVFPGLEEEEDTFVQNRVKLNECMMLRRVLGQDKSDVLPKACKIASTSQHKSFMSRLSHLGDTPDVAGRVSFSECSHLSDALQMVSGGASFLPGACAAMMKKEEHDLAAKFEQENAKVYQRIARRNSWIAKEDFPPSAT